MFWRTGCTGCGRICGERRSRSESEASPEANGQGRLGRAPSTAALAGKTAVEVATRTAEAGTGQVGGGAGAGRATPKTRAVESAVPVTATGTLSCSCLVSKRKNFVSRDADHSAALRGPFPPGVEKSARPVPPASAFLMALGVEPPVSWLVRPPRQAKLPANTPEAPPPVSQGSGCVPVARTGRGQLCPTYST
jgi:hypothetical protein